MKVNLASLKDRAAWEAAGVKLPSYDVAAMREATKKAPIWVHFGAGNIFRAFVAALQQRLLDEGLADRGIVAADTFDVDNIRMIYGGYDNLTMSVTLNADATMDKEIIASVSEALVAQPAEEADFARLKEIFAAPSLQMVSFTITEKGYALRGLDGEYLPVVASDLPVCREIMGDFALYFPTGSVEQLAQQLDAATRIDFQQRSAQALAIASHYNVESIVRQWRELLG